MQKVLGVYQNSENDSDSKTGIHFVVSRDNEKFIVSLDKLAHYQYDEQIIKDNYIEIEDPVVVESLIEEYNRRMILYIENDKLMSKFPLNIKDEINLCFYKRDREELDKDNLLNNIVNKLIINHFIFKIVPLSDILLDQITEKNMTINLIHQYSTIVIQINPTDSNIILLKIIEKDYPYNFYGIYKHLVNSKYDQPLLTVIA